MKNRMYMKFCILFIFTILLINFISAYNYTRTVKYIFPSPAEGEVLNQSFVGINVSIYEDYPSTNCILYLLYNNKTQKMVMEREGHICYQESMDLINNTNYTAYITIMDEEGNTLKSYNLSFSTNFEKLPCSTKSVYEIRNCAINWLEGSSKSILVTVIIICAFIIGLDYLKERNSQRLPT